MALGDFFSDTQVSKDPTGLGALQSTRYKVSRHKISYRTCCTEDTALSVVALSLSPLLPSPYSEVMQNMFELAALVLLLCNVSISKSLRRLNTSSSNRYFYH